MKIDILARDGSPLGVTMNSLWGRDHRVGVGGSEYGILTLCEGWANRGYQVRYYNDPYDPHASPFQQLPTTSFNPQEDRDILITFRSPNPRALAAKGKHVWLSCDQFTIDNYTHFAEFMDDIVCISPFHIEYFKTTYNIQKAIWIDLPVRTQDFELFDVERVPHQFLFSSVPERGLINLWRMWPAIVADYPDAMLYITSDYRLWGSDGPGNTMHRVKWSTRKNFEFLGAVKRDELIKLELQSDVLLYPSNYDELMCIAVAEAECAGAYPITSATGALPTTNLGTVLVNDANDNHNDVVFVNAVHNFLDDPYKENIREWTKRKSCERFCLDKVLDQWDEKIFK